VNCILFLFLSLCTSVARYISLCIYMDLKKDLSEISQVSEEMLKREKLIQFCPKDV